MAVKSIRRVDDQGRIIMPSHIRKALNLNQGAVVEVELDDDGTIRMKASAERCAICGESVEGKRFTPLTNGQDRKLICYDCAQAVARAMMKA